MVKGSSDREGISVNDKLDLHVFDNGILTAEVILARFWTYRHDHNHLLVQWSQILF
jgi:hypothetical protein